MAIQYIYNSQGQAIGTKAPTNPTPVPTPTPNSSRAGSIPASGYGSQYAGNPTSWSLSQQQRTSNQAAPIQSFSTPEPSGPSAEEIARQEAENRVRGDINSGYDAYFSNLDAQIGGLPGQQKGQEQIVNNNYSQGLTDINAQKESSLGDLNTQRRKNNESQVNSLNDIAENIRNLFQTGSVSLGARGAGDSSAVNQYSYAIGKLGAKERGNVLNQTRSIENDIADRETKLNNIVTQETAKLKTNRDNQILQIAQWFQDKQSELQSMKAQGQLQRGQSLASLSMALLQEAQQRLIQADADAKNQQSMLNQWAISHANTIGQLRSNLQQVGGYQAPGVSANQIGGMTNYDAGGNASTPFGYGLSQTNDLYKGLYGGQ